MHALRVRDECGGPVRVVGPGQAIPLEDSGPLPEIYTLGSAVMYQAVYDEQGILAAARRFVDPGLIARCRQVIADLYDQGEPLAAEATVLCTANTKDFPASLIETLGLEVLAPDQLLSQLIVDYEPQMLAVHRTAVASLKSATDASTVAALRRASAPMAAALIARLLEAE